MRSTRLAGASALATALLLGGCTDEGRLIRAVEGCPKAVARVGRPVRVAWTKSIGTAGVWFPPVPGCTYKSYVEGPAGKGAALYFAEGDPAACFHLVVHTGRMRDLGNGASQAIMAVTDLRTCTEVEE